MLMNGDFFKTCLNGSKLNGEFVEFLVHAKSGLIRLMGKYTKFVGMIRACNCN